MKLLANNSLSEEKLAFKVIDVVDRNGNWKWEYLRNNFLDEVCNMFEGTLPPNVAFNNDTVY